ncbi:MAG: hypothetical protein M0Z82_08635 [Actinomycetota bacterium]|nr:hypothetical protein [Actinomycetota bacterium]
MTDLGDQAALPLPGEGEDPLVEGDEYATAYGETLAETLDLDSWEAGFDLEALYGRVEAEIGPAIEQERRIQDTVRRELFPLLARAHDAPPEAGVHSAGLADLEDVTRKVLFSGELETCDGTTSTHDTLLVTVTQIGICLISYQGHELALSQRLFRRDLRVSSHDPLDEVRAILERRQTRAATGVNDRRDTLSELGRRGIMSYAERATLLDRSHAAWRMGHGNPVPYELLTGSGSMELLAASLAVLRRLVDYQQWVFVPSALKDRVLLTLGAALRPLEYAVVRSAESTLARIVEGGHYGGEWHQEAKRFVEQIGPKIAVGIYRAGPHSPATPFFGHVERIHEAAHVAMADSLLQEYRGFPLSIDLADAACQAVFGGAAFDDAVTAAYQIKGEPVRYLSERQTRTR